MAILGLYLAALASIATWWLSRQRLTAKPWLESGLPDEPLHQTEWREPAIRIGLGLFLAVAGTLFALSLTAYFMRMSGSDWAPVPKPNLLWLNTDVLFLSSIALHSAQRGARVGNLDQTRLGIVASGLAAVVFVAGQVLAWRQLVEAGFGLAGNPANSFFYLLTGLHGLHLVGGLAALAWIGSAALRAHEAQDLIYGVTFCATYWHFLLLVWLLLFGVLMLT